MTPKQCREARELLGWSEQDLSRHSGSRLQAVLNYEIGRGRTMRNTVSRLRAALEDARVEFIPENGGDAGVRMRKMREGGE